MPGTYIAGEPLVTIAAFAPQVGCRAGRTFFRASGGGLLLAFLGLSPALLCLRIRMQHATLPATLPQCSCT